MTMLIIVQIDLSTAELDLFEQYEKGVLALLVHYGAVLIERVRSVDGNSETHLLEFPDASSLNAFKADPARIDLQELWAKCGASTTYKEVARLNLAPD